jgi:hypothetical protein
MKFRLIAEHSVETKDGNYPRRVEHRFEGEQLDGVLENIGMFLRGVGYYFDGMLMPVELDDDPPIDAGSAEVH